MKPGADTAAQGQQFRRAEPIGQPSVAAQDGKQEAFRVEAGALEQSQFGQASRRDFLRLVDEQDGARQRGVTVSFPSRRKALKLP